MLVHQLAEALSFSLRSADGPETHASSWNYMNMTTCSQHETSVEKRYTGKIYFVKR
jgi:hypothetical protein